MSLTTSVLERSAGTSEAARRVLPDHLVDSPRAQRLQGTVDEIHALQVAERLPAEVDPACLTIMLMAAAMAPTTLPHVIEGVCRVDPGSP